MGSSHSIYMHTLLTSIKLCLIYMDLNSQTSVVVVRSIQLIDYHNRVVLARYPHQLGKNQLHNYQSVFKDSFCLVTA